MDNGQIIYLWKQLYWQAIGQGKEPQKAAEIANHQIGLNKNSSANPELSRACA